MTLGRNDATRSLQARMAGRFRRLAYEVAVRLLDRIGKGSALDDRQRTWLIGELEADLSDQIEDLRETGTVPSELGAQEMVVTTTVWAGEQVVFGGPTVAKSEAQTCAVLEPSWKGNSAVFRSQEPARAAGQGVADSAVTPM
jgi:hypothetical protein